MENFFYLLLVPIFCCSLANGQFNLFNRQPNQQQSQSLFGQQPQPQSSFGQYNRRPPQQQQFPGNQKPGAAFLIPGNSISNGPTPRPTQPYPTPDEDCCSMRAQSREDCGYRGIKKSACLRRQCCYDSDPGDTPGCFKPLKKPCIASSSFGSGGSPVEGTCRTPIDTRLDCGYQTELGCKKAQCCWQVRDNQSPRCYYNDKSAPKLSSWEQWSTCTKPCRSENLQKRERACIYNDGRLAPTAYCRGEASEEKNCTCEPPCMNDVDEKTCKSWERLCGESEVVNKMCRKFCGICLVVPSDSECVDSLKTCKNFPKLCNTSDTYKKICRLTCQTCQMVSPVILKATARPKRRQDICIDKFKSCKDVKDYCVEESRFEEMLLLCPRTCRMCDLITTAAPPVTLPPNSFLLQTLTNPFFNLPAFSLITEATASSCVDKHPESCKKNRELCKGGNRFAQSMADLCPLTCNSCTQPSLAPSKDPLLAALSTNPYTDPPVTSKKSPLSYNIFQPAAASGLSNNCVDRYPESCKRNKALCNSNNDFARRMSRLCPVTCNTCPRTSGTVDPLIAALYNPAIPTAFPQVIQTPRTFYPYIPTRYLAPSYPPATQRPATANIYYPTAAQTPVTYIESCENTLDICDQYATSCNDAGSNWKILCPRTCQSCSAPPATKSTVVVYQGQCVDSSTSCSEFIYMCNQNNEFRQKCRYTCGSCDYAPTATPTPATISLPLQNIGSNACDDKLTTCRSNKQLCKNKALTVVMETACKQTCGYCSQTDFGQGIGIDNSASAQLPQVGQWSTWSQCTASCGEGVKSRSRICNPQASTNQGTTCPNLVEYSVCNGGYCVKNNSGR